MVRRTTCTHPSNQVNLKMCKSLLFFFFCFGLTRLVVVDVSKQEEDDAEGDESSPPSQRKHQNHRDHCAEQRCPFAVIVKCWPPT